MQELSQATKKFPMIKKYAAYVDFERLYAPLVVPECETINRVDEALTLKGMKILWEENS